MLTQRKRKRKFLEKGYIEDMQWSQVNIMTEILGGQYDYAKVDLSIKGIIITV